MDNFVFSEWKKESKPAGSVPTPDSIRAHSWISANPTNDPAPEKDVEPVVSVPTLEMQEINPAFTGSEAH